jgi:hypothetical protein
MTPFFLLLFFFLWIIDNWNQLFLWSLTATTMCYVCAFYDERSLKSEHGFWSVVKRNRVNILDAWGVT